MDVGWFVLIILCMAWLFINVGLTIIGLVWIEEQPWFYKIRGLLLGFAWCFVLFVIGLGGIWFVLAPIADWLVN